MSTLKTNNIQHVDLADPSILLNSDGSVSIAGTVSYEDSTNVDSVGIITGRVLVNAQKQVHVGTGVSVKSGGINVTAGITTVQALQATTGNFSSNVDIAGELTVAETIAHTGDTNNKISFPAADTITLTTSGSEALRVDASQRLLIGTSDIDSVSDGEVPKLIVKGTDSTAGAAFVRHSANAAGTGVFFGKSRNATIGSNTIVQDDDELGRITFSGDDGTNINTMGAQIASFVDGTPGENDMPGRLVFYTTADGASGVTERMRIASNGYVGINQASPRNTFDVTGNIFVSNGGQIQITGTASSKGLQLIGQDDGTSLIGTMGSSGEHLLFRTGSTERMRLLVGGPHLLIGGTATVNEITETSANAGIVIGGTSYGNAGLAIINSTSGTGRIYFGDNTGSDAARNRGMIGYYHSSDFMIFSTASAERVRINSDGEFGINTSTPVEKLGISGNIRLVNPTGTTRRINALPSGSYNVGTSGGSAIAFHRVSDGGGGSDEIAFETHWQGNRHGESARFTKQGNLAFPSGQGIDFSATGQAASPSSEILDDYEEGTWTFAIVPGGGSYQYNYGTTGYYRKIGNTVFINAWVHLIVSSAVSGGITLTGLPFACQNRSRNWIPVGGYGHGGPPIASSGLWMIVTPNSTNAAFLYNDDQFGVASNLTAGNLPTSAELYINGSYFTDS